MKRLAISVLLAACSMSPAIPPMWTIVVDQSCYWCCIRYQLDLEGCEVDSGEPDDPCQAVRTWAYQQWRECISGCDDPDLNLRVFELWRSGHLTTDQLIETLIDIEERAAYMPLHRSRRVMAGSAG